MPCGKHCHQISLYCLNKVSIRILLESLNIPQSHKPRPPWWYFCWTNKHFFSGLPCKFGRRHSERDSRAQLKEPGNWSFKCRIDIRYIFTWKRNSWSTKMVPDPYKVEDCCERLSSGTSFNLQKKILCTFAHSIKIFWPTWQWFHSSSGHRAGIWVSEGSPSASRTHCSRRAAITIHHTRTTTIAPSF